MHIEDGSNLGHFEPTPGWRDIENSPSEAVVQTSKYLDLYLNGPLNNPEIASHFLRDITFPYLTRTLQGLSAIVNVSEPGISLNWTGAVSHFTGREDVEDIEAAGYSLVVFSKMPDLPSTVLPKGYSRRGFLRPPSTKQEFFARVEELRKTVYRIEKGQVIGCVDFELMHDVRLARTLAFFKTGALLPKILPDRDRLRFHKILDDIE